MQHRNIMDNIILVHEEMHSRKEEGEVGIVITLDMENVFDRVNHSFIFLVMEKLGFNNEFIYWIKSCIGSPWIAPLINGHLAPFFAASRGIFQGSPLFPLLYIIMVEYLSCITSFGVGCLPLGLNIARNFSGINHSQFIDDTLLIRGASLVIIARFKKNSRWISSSLRGIDKQFEMSINWMGLPRGNNECYKLDTRHPYGHSLFLLHFS